MNYWLIKSEPDVFSLDDLIKSPKQSHCWDGVRNYQARNFMRDGMAVGDLCFFYYSNAKPPGIAGICKVSSEPYPDPTQFDSRSDYFDADSKQDNPRWVLRDMTYVRHLKRFLALDELKATPALAELLILRKGNRLSITPVEKRHWDAVLKLET